MMKTIIPIVLMMMVIPSALAQYPLTSFTTLECSTNQTLWIENIEIRCIDGKCQNFTTQKEQFCLYGCSEDDIQPQCNPSPFDVTTYFVLPAFLIFLAIVIIVARKLI